MAGGLWQSLEVLSWGLYESATCSPPTSATYPIPWMTGAAQSFLASGTSTLGLGHQVPPALMSWAMALAGRRLPEPLTAEQLDSAHNPLISLGAAGRTPMPRTAAIRGWPGQETVTPSIIIGHKGRSRAALAGLGEEIITTVFVESFHMLLSLLSYSSQQPQR